MGGGNVLGGLCMKSGVLVSAFGNVVTPTRVHEGDRAVKLLCSRQVLRQLDEGLLFDCRPLLKLFLVATCR